MSRGRDNEPVAGASCPGEGTHHTRRLEACATSNKPAKNGSEYRGTKTIGSENRGTNVSRSWNGSTEGGIAKNGKQKKFALVSSNGNEFVSVGGSSDGCLVGSGSSHPP